MSNTSKPLSFESWIISFKNEDSATGDLAKDYVLSVNESQIKGEKTKTLEESLQYHGASTQAWIAFNRAMCAYSDYKLRFLEKCD